MKKTLLYLLFLLPFTSISQNAISWQNVDSLYQPLPKSIHVYYTATPIDTAPFRAFYIIADLKDKRLDFTTDTTLNRRLTPTKFFEKNASPLVVVNGTFFSFETGRNLNTVIKDGKSVSYDVHVHKLKSDSLPYIKHLGSAIGISKKREADVTWIYNDSFMKTPVAHEWNPVYRRDEYDGMSKFTFAPWLHHYPKTEKRYGIKDKWKVQTAIGGGPVLLYDGNIRITNNEEYKFTGKAINDKHPRTAMGYTKDNKLIILVVEGRNKLAGGATLTQEAQILKDLGCVEALNLDGGGSSCLLINGKETIKPSDKEGQRAVPAVFIIKAKK
ncbi:MAG: hypothetical protein JWR72_3707 [Flavisolibacter sp.]|nr:hypothetical protein [Flavisolibacter sp.]